LVALLRSPSGALALEELDSRGGWRTLFDPDSEEWHWSGLAEKIALLDRFRTAGFGVSELLDSFAQQCEDRGRLDRARAATQAAEHFTSRAATTPGSEGGQGPHQRRAEGLCQLAAEKEHPGEG